MSRKAKFLSNIVTGYALTGFNVVYTLATVPIGLHYLGKEEFGLWLLLIQISSYLILLDLGMSGSIARFLADAKDDVNSDAYISTLHTGNFVFIFQGLIISLIGVAMALVLPPLLAIPSNFREIVRTVMVLQSLIIGAGVGTRIIGSPLWCHQRNDVLNSIGCISLTVGIVIMWLCLHFGLGLYTLPIAGFIAFVINLVLPWRACTVFGFYPNRKIKISFDQHLFWQIFSFGKDIFIMNIGIQLTSASQIVVVARTMGLEAAATWSISTKVFTMAQQLCGRILESSAGGLTEMHVRGEKVKLFSRFKDIIALSASVATICSTSLIFLNGPFLFFWTNGQVSWEQTNNLLLGYLLFTTILTRCYSGLVGISKEVLGMKYIFFIEGVSFVVIAFYLSRAFGFQGILIASLLTNIFITGLYCFRRTQSFFRIPLRDVFGWTKSCFVILLLSLLSLPAYAVSSHLGIGNFEELSAGMFIVVFVIIPLVWRYGIHSTLRLEIYGQLEKLLIAARKLRSSKDL